VAWDADTAYLFLLMAACVESAIHVVGENPLGSIRGLPSLPSLPNRSADINPIPSLRPFLCRHGNLGAEKLIPRLAKPDLVEYFRPSAKRFVRV
jgi:hypothetical protein